MRALVLFHLWDVADDAIDPIAVVSELIWENSSEEEVQDYFRAAKIKYGVTDAPPESFRTAWVTFQGVHELFATPDLGGVEVTPEEA